MSTPTTKCKRYVLSLAVGQAHPQDESNPAEGHFMTLEEMKFAADNYEGAPTRLFHYGTDESTSGCADSDMGKVRTSWIHDDKLYTLFDIERDWRKPWAYKTGDFVLRGWFNAVSTATRAQYDPATGRTRNCIDKPIELSVCTAATARRGPECAILWSGVVEENSETGEVTPVQTHYSSGAQYNGLSAPNQPAASSSSSHSAAVFTQFATKLMSNAAANQQQQPPGTPQPGATPLPPTTPAAPSDDLGAPPKAGAKRGHDSASDPASKRADAQGAAEQARLSAEANAALSRAGQDSDPNNLKDNANDVMSVLAKQAEMIERLSKQIDDQRANSEKKEQDRETAEKKRVLEERKAKLQQEVKSAVDMLTQMYVESKQDPDADPMLKQLRSLQDINDEESLVGAERAKPFVLACAFKIEHSMREAERRGAEADDLRRQLGQREQATASLGSQLAKLASTVAKTGEKNDRTGLGSRVPGAPAPAKDAFRWIGGGPNGAAAAPPAQQQQQPPGTPQPGSTPMPPTTPAAPSDNMETDEHQQRVLRVRALFEETSYGHVVLKSPARVPSHIASDQVLPASEAHAFFPRPRIAPKLRQPGSLQGANIQPVPFGIEGMQGRDPEFFVELRDGGYNSGKQERMNYDGLVGKKYDRPKAQRELIDDEKANFGYTPEITKPVAAQ